MLPLILLAQCLVTVYGIGEIFTEYGPPKTFEYPFLKSTPIVTKYGFTIPKNTFESYGKPYEFEYKEKPAITSYNYQVPHGEKKEVEAPLKRFFDVPDYLKFPQELPGYKYRSIPYTTPTNYYNIPQYVYDIPKSYKYDIPSYRDFNKHDTPVVTKYEFNIPTKPEKTQEYNEYQVFKKYPDVLAFPASGEYFPKYKDSSSTFLDKPSGFGLTPSKALPLLDEFGRPETWGPAVPVVSSYNYGR